MHRHQCPPKPSGSNGDEITGADQRRPYPFLGRSIGPASGTSPALALCRAVVPGGGNPTVPPTPGRRAQRKGCDAIAAAWAAQAGVPIVTFAPNAQRFGKSAGFKRNDQLVSLRPVEAIICQGTGIQSHLLDELKAASVPVHAFRYDAQAPMPAEAKRQQWG